MKNIEIFFEAYMFMVKSSKYNNCPTALVYDRNILFNNKRYNIEFHIFRNSISIFFNIENETSVVYILDYNISSGELIFTQPNNGTDTNIFLSKEFLTEMLNDSKAMSEIEFVLSYGRHPLRINPEFYQLLKVAFEEGLFNI